MGSRAEAVKQYKKSENKRNKDLKYIKMQNKMLYSIVKNSRSRRELKNDKNINAKYSKKRGDSSRNSSSNESYSDSYLSSDSDWYEEIEPAGRRETNILDHLVTNNTKKDKDKHNYDIENEPKFDGSFNLSSRTK